MTGNGKTLVVQIPAYNEALRIAGTIADVPRAGEGFERVLVLVVDDGSTDGTAEAARGAERVVRFPANRGLAMAFQKGLEVALEMGADVVVNFDADNQYPGDRIAELARMVAAGKADIVLGERDFDSIEHFSGMKRFLQRFGSSVVSRLSGVRCSDVTTGFRAMSREAAQSLYVANLFTYTIETLFLAGARKLSVAGVKISTRPKLRESRLFGNNVEYVGRSFLTIARATLRYRALAILTWLALPLFVAGVVVIGRFLLYHFVWQPGGAGHVQSLVLAGVLIVVGVLLVAMGFLADAVGTNRRLLEEALILLRRRKP